MDRQTWLGERRAAVELDYTRDSADYEADNYPISDAHRTFVARPSSLVRQVSLLKQRSNRMQRRDRAPIDAELYRRVQPNDTMRR
jgi:hypothetical protein